MYNFINDYEQPCVNQQCDKDMDFNKQTSTSTNILLVPLVWSTHTPSFVLVNNYAIFPFFYFYHFWDFSIKAFLNPVLIYKLKYMACYKTKENTNANTGNYMTQHHTIGPVMLILQDHPHHALLHNPAGFQSSTQFGVNAPLVTFAGLLNPNCI